LTIRAGARLDATDFDLPAAVTAYGAGQNTVTATSFADLPTYPCEGELTNPHPTLPLLVLVTYSAWMNCSAGVGVRAALAISGSTTVVAGIGGGAAAGWGEVLYEGDNGTNSQHSASYTVELPVSANAATFTFQAYRDSASGTQQVNYPTLRLIPLRYVS